MSSSSSPTSYSRIKTATEHAEKAEELNSRAINAVSEGAFQVASLYLQAARNHAYMHRTLSSVALVTTAIQDEDDSAEDVRP